MHTAMFQAIGNSFQITLQNSLNKINLQKPHTNITHWDFWQFICFCSFAVHTTQPTWWMTWKVYTEQLASREKVSPSSLLTMKSETSLFWSIWTMSCHQERCTSKLCLCPILPPFPPFIFYCILYPTFLLSPLLLPPTLGNNFSSCCFRRGVELKCASWMSSYCVWTVFMSWWEVCVSCLCVLVVVVLGFKWVRDSDGGDRDDKQNGRASCTSAPFLWE